MLAGASSGGSATDANTPASLIQGLFKAGVGFERSRESKLRDLPESIAKKPRTMPAVGDKVVSLATHTFI